jgi:hypothetical protein
MGWTEDLQAVFEQQYADAVAELRAWWDGNVHHGCFCGAGSRCDAPVDGLDVCCQQHDTDYSAVGQSADTMWTVDGFIDCQHADSALAACAAGADLKADDPHSSPDVEGFRDHLIWLFSTRASIGAAMHAWRDRVKAVEDAWDVFTGYLTSQADSINAADPQAVEGARQHVEYLRSLDVQDDVLTNRMRTSAQMSEETMNYLRS